MNTISTTITNTALQTVWIIDDNDVDTMIGCKIIEKYDASITTTAFNQPMEAVKMLGNYIKNSPEKLPDLIFVDLYMPVLDGRGFLKVFEELTKNDFPQIKIILLSSIGTDKDIPQPSNHPQLLGSLMKPIDLNKMRNIQNTHFL